MASSKSKRHTHKYYRVQLGSDKVWACALPDCNHHMPTHMTPLVLGKSSLCWKCGEALVLDPINMKMDKPICDDCNSTSDATLEYLREHGMIPTIE